MENILHNNSLKRIDDFNSEKTKNHPQVKANLGGFEFEVDKGLKDILEKINKMSSGPITTMSCQYNCLGLSVICINYLFFANMMNIIRKSSNILQE